MDLETRELADAYRKGNISLGRWEREMRALTKDSHLLNAAAAKGGWDRLTPADYGRVGQAVREQYRHLDGLAGELAAGFQSPDGRFITRAQMYTRSGRTTYETTSRSVARDAEFTEERSILHPADHCESCVAQADLGFQPLGSLLPPGSRQCLSNCKCTLEYR